MPKTRVWLLVLLAEVVVRFIIATRNIGIAVIVFFYLSCIAMVMILVLVVAAIGDALLRRVKRRT
jgi:hypothetical protein